MIVDCSDGVLGLLSVFARQTQGERIRPLCVCEWNTRPYYYGRMGRGCTEHTIIWLDILTMYKTKEGLRAGLYLPLLFKEIDPESTGVYVFER